MIKIAMLLLNSTNLILTNLTSSKITPKVVKPRNNKSSAVAQSFHIGTYKELVHQGIRKKTHNVMRILVHKILCQVQIKVIFTMEV